MKWKITSAATRIWNQRNSTDKNKNLGRFCKYDLGEIKSLVEIYGSRKTKENTSFDRTEIAAEVIVILIHLLTL